MPRFDEPTQAEANGVSDCQPGLIFLRQALLYVWGTAGASYCGCYRPGGTTDSGRLGPHAVGRADDICISPSHLATGTAIFYYVIDRREALGLQEAIFNSLIWRADNQAAGIHAYTVNRHIDHVHIALNKDGAAMRTSFFQAPGKPGGFLPMLSDAEQKELLDTVRLLNQQFHPTAAKPSVLGDIAIRTKQALEDPPGSANVPNLPKLIRAK
jgi:hypothetical protein